MERTETMELYVTRKNIIQNLKDADCTPEDIEMFLKYLDENKREQQLHLLEGQREQLLNRVHKDEKRISCLDYLIYQIRQEGFIG